MKKLIKRLLPRPVKALLGIRSQFSKLSYSQEGEDRILFALLGLNDCKRSGYYIDVGAHHPERFSNTRLFYDQGWRGINIDAMPGSMQAFEHERSRDINIEAAVAETAKSLTFYEFNEPALNGFSYEVASTRDKARGWKIVRKRLIETRRLETLLEHHLPKGQAIDFMSVDVEGFDLAVLQSNDWRRFRPAVVLVEDDEGNRPERTGLSQISTLMKAQGYHFCCKTLLTTFYVDTDRLAFGPMGARIISEVK